ncbi:tail fiber domain-containing protein [Winogradskyella bathintestinalis]|uniref:Tail fiber domain-containing protein n=1 Tax=Winogradskyella bathintestinalis TaxID=3035208 RepID=A0ABT7ZSD2_9FLAO|nr:tail fiber domain-containing protein [Winogradskyella bathintestinalis]MDN3491916.1 tail fiber domain-containing protein [Winogradskyella bathintestinalis]
MKKILQTIAFALCICLAGYAQNPPSNFINYQGVASDASGEVISETAIALQIALKFGSETATASYIENHNPTTDANGVFSIQIGNGTLVSGAYDVSNFGVEASYITVSLNGVEIGTTELNAVPYALSSGDAQWTANGTNIENKNSGLVKVINGLEVSGGISGNSGATITEFSTDNTFSDNSDSSVPTEQAIKTYVDNAISGSDSSIDDLSDGKTNYSSLFLGADAGFSSTPSNHYNVGVGINSLYSNSDGRYNTAIGTNTLYANTTGLFNVAIGSSSLESNTIGGANVAIGLQALNSNISGTGNVGVGSGSIYANIDGGWNTAIGEDALGDNTTGDYNIAVGSYALEGNTTGEANVAIGRAALISNISGNGNVALGNKAGLSAQGSNKLYIHNSGASSPLIYGEFDNRILRFNGTTEARSFENSPTTTDLILGGTANTTAGDDGIISSDPDYAGSDIFIRSNDAVVIELDYDNDETGQFEIKAGDGSEIFEVDEGGNVYVNGSLAHSSDRRLKRDIEDLQYGLKEILQLQPKAYNWKNRTQPNKSLGLIAQEVQPLLKEIVTTKDNEQKTLAISYTELIPILINAIKEQQAQIEALKTTNTTNDVALAEILKRVKTLEYTAELNKTKGSRLSSAK